MTVEVIYKNRRSDTDRRQNFSPYQGIERRSGIDRRKIDNKLKHMLEKQAKIQNKKPLRTIQTESGKIAVRRKGAKRKSAQI